MINIKYENAVGRLPLRSIGLRKIVPFDLLRVVLIEYNDDMMKVLAISKYT
jgi:hypothetical protein